jgi:preprotein translocase subunit SecE
VNDWIKIAIWVVAIGVPFALLWRGGHIKRLADYISETREELKKCSWPTWEELKGSTLLIIVMVSLLGAFVVITDRVLFAIFIH